MIATRRSFIGALLAAPLVACLPEPVPASLDIGPMFFDGERGDPFGGRLSGRKVFHPFVAASDDGEIIRIIKIENGVMHLERNMRANVHYGVYPGGGRLRTSKPESVFAWGPR